MVVPAKSTVARMEDDSDPVVLRESMPWEEAMVVRGLLESAGIVCEVQADSSETITSYTRAQPRFVRLFVRRGDHADAVAALAE